MHCHAHAGMAALVAAGLGAFDPEGLEAGLRELDLPIAGLPALGAPIRSGALHVRCEGDLDDLLIDHVVAHGAGHEAVVAVVLCELGRRAGMPVGVVAAAGRHFVGHDEVVPWLLDPATGELIDARGIDDAMAEALGGLQRLRGRLN